MTEDKYQEKTNSGSAKDVAKRVLRHENIMLAIVLAALTAVMGVVTNGLTASRANMANVLLQSSIRGVVAIGQAFVILTSGIDISVGGVGLFCSIVGGSVLTESMFNIVGYSIPIPAAILLMLVVGLGWGTINGTLVARIGMPALIVTLGMWEVTDGAAFNLSGGRSLSEIPEAMAFIGQGQIAGVPVPVVIFIVVAVIAYFVLNHTTFGRNIYAVGGNPVSAWLSGINVKQMVFSVYAISGFCAGLAGSIMLGRVMSASMRTLEGLELDSIAAAAIGGVSLMGGRGNLIGVVIGAIIIGVVNNGMSVLGAGPDMQGIVKGLIIIIAVAIDYIRGRR